MKRGFGLSCILGLLVWSGCATTPVSQAVPLEQALTNISQSMEQALAQTSDPVSVSSFVNVNAEQASKTQTFGDYTADTLLSDLKLQDPALKVVERSELDKVLQERQYSSEGLLTTDKLKNLGAFLPARYILTGNFTIFPQMVELDARLLDVRDGTVAVSHVVDISNDQDVRSLLAGVLPPPRENPEQTSSVIVLTTRTWPADFHYPLVQAKLAAQNHQVYQALWFYQQAVRRYPRQSIVWADYGEYLERLHRYPAALGALNHALALHRTPAVLQAHARVLWALGRREQARREWAQAKALARDWRLGDNP